MPTFPAEPAINGKYPQYSKIEYDINGVHNFRGVTEINYSDSCEPGEARGNRQIILGTTDGEYKAEGSMTMHKRHAQELINDIGHGFYLVSFPIVVVYDMNDGLGLIRDTLEGVRLKKNDQGHKQGPEALVTKFDLFVTLIRWNGISPVPEI